MNQTVDILCRARALYASAPSHAPVGATPEPGTNCVIYALEFASPGASKWGSPALKAVMGTVGTTGVVAWNAEHSTEEVLAAFDRAIAAEGLRVPDLQHTEQRDPVHAGQES